VSDLAHARTLLDLRRWDEAVEAAERAVAADPEAAEPRRVLAVALLSGDASEGALEEALDAADSAVALEPEVGEGHRLRAHALLGLGQGAYAIAAAREAVRLDPGLDAQLTLGRCLLAGGGDLVEAERTARRAIEIAPERVDAHLLLGDVMLGWEVPEEALVPYERAPGAVGRRVDRRRHRGRPRAVRRGHRRQQGARRRRDRPRRVPALRGRPRRLRDRLVLARHPRAAARREQVAAAAALTQVPSLRHPARRIGTATQSKLSSMTRYSPAAASIPTTLPKRPSFELERW
jgi:tetratricopeptide (TPR) repeat protein